MEHRALTSQAPAAGVSPGSATHSAALPEALRRPLASVRGLAELLLERPGPFAHAFDDLILALIVLSVASVILEAIPELPAGAVRAFHLDEIIVVSVFSLEYLLRLVAAKNKLAFIFSFPGLVDLISIAPFYLAGVDTRAAPGAAPAAAVAGAEAADAHPGEHGRTSARGSWPRRMPSLEKAQAAAEGGAGDVARALQLAILPGTFPAKAGCDGAARMIPATTMGGDFYDFIELPQGQIGLVMADVSGKGVPAAFFMAVARTNLRDLAPQHTNPGACLVATNEALCAENPMDLFVTVFYAVLEPQTGMLWYANGGHNPPYLRRADGAVEALDGRGGPILGVLPGVRFPPTALQLRPGDRVVLYTDGVTEAFNPADEAYGAPRLVDEVRVHGGEAPAALVERICASVASFSGSAPQSDDITLTVLSWNAP